MDAAGVRVLARLAEPFLEARLDVALLVEALDLDPGVGDPALVIGTDDGGDVAVQVLVHRRLLALGAVGRGRVRPFGFRLVLRPGGHGRRIDRGASRGPGGSGWGPRTRRSLPGFGGSGVLVSGSGVPGSGDSGSGVSATGAATPGATGSGRSTGLGAGAVGGGGGAGGSDMPSKGRFWGVASSSRTASSQPSSFVPSPPSSALSFTLVPQPFSESFTSIQASASAPEACQRRTDSGSRSSTVTSVARPIRAHISPCMRFGWSITSQSSGGDRTRVRLALCMLRAFVRRRAAPAPYPK